MTAVAILEFTAQPGHRDEALTILGQALRVTRAYDGNLGVDVLLDEDPDRFLLVERWETAAHHGAYQAWRLTPEGETEGLGALLAGPPAVRVLPLADV